MESLLSRSSSFCFLPMLLLFCFCTVRPLSAFPDDLDDLTLLAHAPATMNMPPAHAPAHHPHRPNPHHHHHHHLMAPGPSPLLAPAPAPAGHHHQHAHAPAHTPAHAPAATQGPSGPRMPRSFIAVQGVVYCKSCKYAGVDTLLGATPLLGAEVKLVCNSSRLPVVGTTKTDKNGYFFMKAPKTVTSYAFHKCKVSLVSSPPTSPCKNPTPLHGGLAGAPLRPEKPFMADKLPFVLYSVGPLAFEPQCPRH